MDGVYIWLMQLMPQSKPSQVLPRGSAQLSCCRFKPFRMPSSLPHLPFQTVLKGSLSGSKGSQRARPWRLALCQLVQLSQSVRGHLKMVVVKLLQLKAGWQVHFPASTWYFAHFSFFHAQLSQTFTHIFTASKPATPCCQKYSV